MKNYFLNEISKGCEKADGSFGKLSFFQIDDKTQNTDTNRYKSGYKVPHIKEAEFFNETHQAWLNNIISKVDYEFSGMVFSENTFNKGVNPHIHIPNINLPTLTFVKCFYKGETNPQFKFYRDVENHGTVVVDPAQLVDNKSFTCEDNLGFIFNSCITPHEVKVTGQDTSIWGFFFFEGVKNVDYLKTQFHLIDVRN